MISKFWKLLDGNKTYIGTILIAVIGIFWKAEVISTDMAHILALIVGSLTGAALRAAIKKSGPVK